MYATDLMAAYYPPIEWTIQDVVPQGQLVLFDGKAKVARKSWTADEMALATTDGGLWLGHFQAGPPRPTLLIATQDNRRRIQERLRILGQGRNRGPILDKNGKPTMIRPDDLLDIYVQSEWPTYDQGGLTKIQKWVESMNGPTVVIIDVLPNFRKIPGGYNIDSAVLGEFAEFAHFYNVTFVGVGHMTKGRLRAGQDFMDLFQGSSGVAATLDVGVGVGATKQGAKESPLYIVGKDVESQEYKLVREDKPFWWVQAEEEAETPGNARTLSEERAKLYQLVTDTPGKTALEIWQMLPVDPVRNVRLSPSGKEWTRNGVRHLLYEMWKADPPLLVNEDTVYYTAEQWKLRHGGQLEMWTPGQKPVERTAAQPPSLWTPKIIKGAH